MVDRLLFTSRSEDWETPEETFTLLDNLFGFQLDACASEKNHKCTLYFDQAADALAQDWHPFARVWCNPPYGRNIGRWMQKAYREASKGCLVVCLVPARTDTRWWHDWVKDKACVTFVRGRLKFGRPAGACAAAPSAAPFPSAVVVYGLDLDGILNERDRKNAACRATRSSGSSPPRHARHLGCARRRTGP